MSPASTASAGGTPLPRRLLGLIAAAIVPLAVMAGAGLLALRAEQTDQAELVGLELARSVANAVDAELRTEIALLETLAAVPALDGGDLEGFRALAERVLALRPEWAAVVLATPDLVPLVDTRAAGTVGPWPIIEQESFARVLRTGLPATGSLTQNAAIGWYFPVRVPVSRDGELRFVVTAVITPEQILNVLIRQQLPGDWVISIVDANGRRVARSRAHEENLGGRLSDTVQEVVEVGGGRQGFGIAFTLEGERIFTPYARLSNGWNAVLGFPTAVADATAARALLIYGGGILLSIGLGALGALWVARTVTRPMAHLRRAAEALGRREPVTPPRTTVREIRDVGRALGSAADDLARSEAQRDELLRREREARETAEAAGRAKDEFMAVLSHELRTPLNAVFGWAKMLDGGQLRDEPMVARAQRAIVRNADVQIRLIDDLLDLSRIVSGKLRIEIRPVDLHKVLQAAVDAVRPAAQARGVRVETTLDPAAGTIDGDPGRVQQVVWNLLTNAINFTGTGGTVRLRLDRAERGVRIEVSDSGEGIAPDLLPHVFERFRQADSSSTRRHGGLGLGLALVKHLVELHGGTVEAESAGSGRGATFTVTLPEAMAEVPLGPRPTLEFDAPAAVTRLEGLRVLVVDDDEEGLDLARTILAGAGAEVETCGSADEAFDVARRWRPHVVLSDIEMPGRDGYWLIRRLRALPVEEGGATPAIALTAYGRLEDRERALAAGFTMHVPKPVDPGELSAIVSAAAAASGASGDTAASYGSG